MRIFLNNKFWLHTVSTYSKVVETSFPWNFVAQTKTTLEALYILPTVTLSQI